MTSKCSTTSGGFTTIPNAVIRDKKLSLSAIGLYGKIAGLPPSWNFSLSGLVAICDEGKDAVRSALNELVDHGYAELHPQTRSAGKFTSMSIKLLDPMLSENNSSRGRISVADVPQREASHNKDINNQECNNNPPITPQGACDDQRRVEDSYDRFEVFWSAYPRCDAKAKAHKEWDKLQPDDNLLAKILQALNCQKLSTDWLRGVGIPYASTYLREHRWEDNPLGNAAKDAIYIPGVRTW